MTPKLKVSQPETVCKYLTEMESGQKKNFQKLFFLFGELNREIMSIKELLQSSKEAEPVENSNDAAEQPDAKTSELHFHLRC